LNCGVGSEGAIEGIILERQGTGIGWLALDQNSTIIAVVELSQSSCLVGGVVPGIERPPAQEVGADPERLLGVLHRWRDEAVRADRTITRIALAFEAGRDGFWLAPDLDGDDGNLTITV
jgi:transposase